MVVTRKSSKRKNAHRGATTSANASNAANATTTTTITDVQTEEEDKELENFRLVASLTDWTSYDRNLGKSFYENFGRILEQKFEQFESDKMELKECVRENFANQQVLKTPTTRKKATTFLMDKIKECKKMNFESDEEMEDLSNHMSAVVDETQLSTASSISQMPPPAPPFPAQTITATAVSDVSMVSATPEPPQVPMTPATPEPPPMTPAKAAPPQVPMAPAKAAPPPQVQMTPAKTAPVRPTPPQVPLTPATPPAKVRKVGGTPYGPIPPVKPLTDSLRKLAITRTLERNKSPIHMPPLVPDLSAINKGTPTHKQHMATPKQMLNTTIQKQQKLREMDEKNEQAKKAREEQLKEKAERTKRDREERRKQVEQNKLQKEQERREKEEQARKQAARVKEFQQAEQKKQVQPASPFRAMPPAPKKATAKKPNVTAAPMEKPREVATAKKQHNSNAKGGVGSSKKAMDECVVDETPPRQNQVPAKEATTAKYQPLNAQVPTAPGTYMKSKEEIRKKRTMEQENEPPLGSLPPSPLLSPISMSQENVNFSDEGEEDSVYDITKEKIFMPSTEENYNVDDLSSGDETDDDNNPRKTVPRWAQKVNIEKQVHAIRRLLTESQIERHFGQIRQPTVEEFFSGYHKEYRQRRASSAVWDSPMSDPTPGVGRFQDQFQPTMNIN